MTMKFSTMLTLNVFFISKIFPLKEFLAGVHGTLGIAQILSWPCEPIILSIEHFEGPTEVQQNSL